MYVMQTYAAKTVFKKRTIYFSLLAYSSLLYEERCVYDIIMYMFVSSPSEPIDGFPLNLV